MGTVTNTNPFNAPVPANTTARPTGPSAGQSISATVTGTEWNAVVDYVNTEVTRRTKNGGAPNYVPRVAANAIIYAADFNRVSNALTSSYIPTPSAAYYGGPANASYAGPGNIPGAAVRANFSIGALVPNVSTGTLITAARVQTLLNAIAAVTPVCLCNCNYCTCNCNYCTCNCNFGCTCNCNYSDERLKSNIIFERKESGLNLYSWSYVWDQTTTYLGVLAQELLGTKYESALSQDKNGFYMVDYNKLPVSMTQI